MDGPSEGGGLGVGRIVPVLTKYTVVQLTRKRPENGRNATSVSLVKP